MEIEEVLGWVRQVGSIPAGADRDALVGLVGTASRLRSWVESREVAIAAALEQVDNFPEHTMAEAGRRSTRDTSRTRDRASTTAEAPPFADALANGSVTGEHVDALTRGLRRLEPAQRQQLAAQAERLADLAGRSTPDQFAKAVTDEVRRLQAGDGLDRLTRQRRDSRLRCWTDRVTGMWCFTGRFDPERGVRFEARLRSLVETLFHDAPPDGCPTDPLERQDFLRAEALAAVFDGQPTTSGNPELVVVLDTTQPDVDGGPSVDWGVPVELPRRVLEELAGTADHRVVVVRNGVVLHAPGQLLLGRTTRIANRAQRRALRALYAACAIPGCAVRFDHCKIHHVVWWEHGGATDLDDLPPVCERHHHAIHDDGWSVTLGPQRELTVTRPDGTRQTTGPPRRNAA